MATTKLAFFILCHKLPEHVIRLVDRLRDDNSLFMIHIDKRAERSVYGALKSFSDKLPGQVYLCKNRYRCYWVRFGIVVATLSCIQETIALNLSFHRSFI